MAPSPQQRISNYWKNASGTEKLLTLAAALIVLGAAGAATGVIDIDKSTNDEGEQLYSAELQYTIGNPLVGGPRVKRIDVTNFRKQGFFSVGDPNRFVLPSEGTARIEVTCGNEKLVDSVSQTYTVQLNSAIERTAQIENLPAGSECTAKIELVENEKVISTKSISFSVPK